MRVVTEDGLTANRLSDAQREELALLQRAVMHLRYDWLPWQEQVAILLQLRDLADSLAYQVEAKYMEPVPEKVVWAPNARGYPNQGEL